VHLGDAAAAEFKKLLAEKLAPLVSAERSAPLPPALQGWRSAEALLQDDRRFGALPRSDRWAVCCCRYPVCWSPSCTRRRQELLLWQRQRGLCVGSEESVGCPFHVR
jgi:hypothetical protein